MKIIPALFEQQEIRRAYDEKTETWFFSVVGIIQVLTQQPDFQAARNTGSRFFGEVAKVHRGRLCAGYSLPVHRE